MTPTTTPLNGPRTSVSLSRWLRDLVADAGEEDDHEQAQDLQNTAGGALLRTSSRPAPETRTAGAIPSEIAPARQTGQAGTPC